MEHGSYFPKAGSLTAKIQIQERQDTTSPTGAVVTAWVNVKTIKAKVYEMFGKEFVAAGQRFSQATTIFSIRYSSDVMDVNASHRIVFNGVPYNIVGYDRKPLDRPRWINLYAYSGDGVEVQA